MERKKYVIMMAAGRGTRMGASVPKQFMDLDGKPILQRSIEKFVYACPDVHIITVLPKEYMDTWKEFCRKNNFVCPQQLVEGGITRFHSVKNALAKVPDGAYVAIHDGVRPMLSSDFIKDMFGRMKSCHALIPILPSVDTLKAVRRIKDGNGAVSYETVPDMTFDRSLVFRAQTPQIFLSEEIKDAYNQAFEMEFTDDASVAQKRGIPLSYTEGERLNVKITTRDDLEFARAILSLPNSSS